MTAEDCIRTLTENADPRKAEGAARYFKTGPGQYGEGDIFLGISVPDLRKLAKGFYGLSLAETESLLHSPLHEAREAALMVMVHRYKTGSPQEKTAIFDSYLKSTAYINNWDLVDSSAEYIVGPHLEGADKALLTDLAGSASIWERRIAMLACLHYIKQGNAAPAFVIINLLKHDPHDLIQKAVGWMLREIGKRCSQAELTDWLLEGDRYKTLPRTALRYAIEHFSPEERQAYLRGTA